MENRNKAPHKLTFTNILCLSLFGISIILFKIYTTKGNLCHDTCSNINSELDVIRCLDACAVNGEDFREPLTFKKILSCIIIVVLLSFILYQFINNFIIRRNGSSKIIEFIEKIKQLLKEFKDKIFNKGKYENFGYKKIDDE